jgi:hypothetical protein
LQYKLSVFVPAYVEPSEILIAQEERDCLTMSISYQTSNRIEGVLKPRRFFSLNSGACGGVHSKELLGRKSSGSSLEIREYGRRDPSR